MDFTFTPSPGICLVEEIKESDTALVLQQKSKNRTVKGKVLAVGASDPEQLPASEYAKVGAIVFFLSYEGNYDIITIKGKDYYVPKFGDLRGILDES